MKRAFWLLAALATACASAELPAGDTDAANASATVAALNLGAGVLSSSFSPDSLAPPHAHSDAPAGAPAASVYTCMHHPEVVSSTKGRCPKCGMDLVPKPEAASSHGDH